MYKFVTNFYKGLKLPNCHILTKKLINNLYETIKITVDLALGNVNWLTFIINRLDNQVKRHITNLSINILS